MTNKIKESNISDGAVTSNKIALGTIAGDRLADYNYKFSISRFNCKLSNSSITINGTSIALGASGNITAGTDWQSVVTSNTTMVSGRGYFVDTSSSTITMTFVLPFTSLGDFVGIVDMGNGTKCFNS